MSSVQAGASTRRVLGDLSVNTSSPSKAQKSIVGASDWRTDKSLSPEKDTGVRGRKRCIDEVDGLASMSDSPQPTRALSNQTAEVGRRDLLIT
jgi:hypothetical protein